ncbi:hypothetical protein BGX38DRAFT_1151824 [Terfezia claveryi]|nr:hypothetical protein BGX38DRAFT_1151824 [Terfezia claveryi]
MGYINAPVANRHLHVCLTSDKYQLIAFSSDPIVPIILHDKVAEREKGIFSFWRHVLSVSFTVRPLPFHTILADILSRRKGHGHALSYNYCGG